MSSQSIENFRQYLIKQKDDALLEGKQIEGIIRDIFPGEKSLIHLLTCAWRAGVVTELRQASNLEAMIAQYTDRLCQEYGLRESSALAAVRIWAYALGVTDVVPNNNISSTSSFISQSGISPETKKCPFCSEEVKKDAQRCKHCHSDISAEAMNELVLQQETLDQDKQKLERERQERDERFISHDKGTVLDTRTNLMWASKDNGKNITWPDAKSYCTTYRGGGYTDWRMPTTNELKGLYASGAHKDKIKLTTPMQWVWASETRSSEAATLDFRDGTPFWTWQSYDDSDRALPVRFADITDQKLTKKAPEAVKQAKPESARRVPRHTRPDKPVQPERINVSEMSFERTLAYFLCLLTIEVFVDLSDDAKLINFQKVINQTDDVTNEEIKGIMEYIRYTLQLVHNNKFNDEQEKIFDHAKSLPEKQRQLIIDTMQHLARLDGRRPSKNQNTFITAWSETSKAITKGGITIAERSFEEIFAAYYSVIGHMHYKKVGNNALLDDLAEIENYIRKKLGGKVTKKIFDYVQSIDKASDTWDSSMGRAYNDEIVKAAKTLPEGKKKLILDTMRYIAELGGKATQGELQEIAQAEKDMKNSACFVATATYRDEDIIEVRFLRAFRDEVISKSKVGIFLIRFYYYIGPYLARVVELFPPFRFLCRLLLDGVVSIIERLSDLKRQSFR